MIRSITKVSCLSALRYSIYHIVETLVEENIGEFSYLARFLEEKTLANSLQMKYGYEKFPKIGEKTLAISHQFVKFATMFSAIYTIYYCLSPQNISHYDIV